MKHITIIGITGGSGSGKTTVVEKISEMTGESVFLPQDNYYLSLDQVKNQSINFDHPDSFDNELLLKHLQDLKEGKSINMPTYDFVNHKRTSETVLIEPRRIIVLEGIMVFHNKKIRDMLDLKLYVDTPSDIRFIRRLERDIEQRGRTVESVIKQYIQYVRKGHMEFIEPTKEFADLIIPEGGHNNKALNVLTSFIKDVVSR